MLNRRLLTSFFLFGLAAPMISVFANTFLWRQTRELSTLVVFNIGTCAGLTIGFIINTLLLRWFSSGKLYAIGCLTQGLIPILLVTQGAHAESFTLPLGLALGTASGLFWSNRNALTSKYTHGASRYRFISMETILITLATIVSPILIGWFIELGEHTTAYSVEFAYQVSAVIGFGLLLGAGALLYSYTLEPVDLSHLRLTHVSHLWNTQRLLEIINGFVDGIAKVLPLVIILLFLGKEGSVGTIQSLSTALSAIVIWLVSKRVKHRHHTTIVAGWILINLIGTALFAWFFTPQSALLFFAMNGLVLSFRWSSFASVMYELIDQETLKNGQHRISYLLDREFFLNLGRILGLLALLTAYHFSQTLTLRFGLLVMILSAFPLLLLLASTVRRIHVAHENITNQES